MSESNTLLSTENRLMGLDALRGLAIILMVLSGVIAYKILPAWMYHAQLPPPTHQFNPNLPGLTWVDLVFPMFLFCMGAAFPMALLKYVNRPVEGVKRIFQRFFYLAVFAIALQHIRPSQLDPTLTSTTAWLTAFAGFGALFLMYTRWPSSFSTTVSRGLTAVGWLGLIAIVVSYPYPNSGSFDLYRSDIILLVLADMALVGGLIWLFTAQNPAIRYVILVAYAALHISSADSGWIEILWKYSPTPWLIKWDYLKYLFIVIPGMFAGEWILKEKEAKRNDYSHSDLHVFTVLTLVWVVMLLIGLQSRWVFSTTLTSIFLGLAIGFFSKKATGKDSDFHKIVWFSSACIWLGLLFEPYQGGIKKDPSSFSYWLITSGISGLLLLDFYILTDIKKMKKGFRLLIGNGKNPMIAYVTFGNLVWPILALTSLEKVILSISTSPITGFLRGVFYTAIVAVITLFFTNKKWFWKT